MANFKTARHQRMVPFDVAVVGAVGEDVQVTSSNRKTAILRNDYVKLTPESATVSAYIEKATQNMVNAKSATHIVALTDATISDGHVATDLKDYRISDLVGATIAQTPVNKTGTIKKVGLYPILDWNDIYQDTDKNDALALTE